MGDDDDKNVTMTCSGNEKNTTCKVEYTPNGGPFYVNMTKSMGNGAGSIPARVGVGLRWKF
jgi:hypothetical protein